MSVELLSGERLDVVCETSTVGRELFDAVVAHLGLPEHYLFGLTYLQGKSNNSFGANKTRKCK